MNYKATMAWKNKKLEAMPDLFLVTAWPLVSWDVVRFWKNVFLFCPTIEEWWWLIIVVVITWPREDCHGALVPDRVDDSLTLYPQYSGLQVSPPDPSGEAQCGAGQTVYNGKVKLTLWWWSVVWCCGVWCGVVECGVVCCVVWCITSLKLPNFPLNPPKKANDW